MSTQNAPKIYWMTTTAAAAHPTTRALGLKMASYGIRVTFNVARSGAVAFLSTPLVRGGTATVGGVAGAAIAGYGIGALAGTGIAYAGWGSKGASDAIDLYTGGVSPGEYFDTVGSALSSYFS